MVRVKFKIVNASFCEAMSWFGLKQKVVTKKAAGVPGDCDAEQLEKLETFRKKVIFAHYSEISQ